MRDKYIKKKNNKIFLNDMVINKDKLWLQLQIWSTYDNIFLDRYDKMALQIL